MDKKPYTAPELVVLGDVIEITRANNEIPGFLDAVYPQGYQFTGNEFTDNQVP